MIYVTIRVKNYDENRICELGRKKQGTLTSAEILEYAHLLTLMGSEVCLKVLLGEGRREE